MSMTKKHYNQLVQVIREARIPGQEHTLDEGMVLTRLCNMLKADNKLFDEDKFYAAVYAKDKEKR